MHAIFVSYASKDQAAADAIVRGLEQCGLGCWIAKRDNKPGADYQAAIVQALEQARVVLLLVSRAANESREVPKEMSLAGDQGKLIIPVRLEDVKASGALAYQATSAHRIDLFPDFGTQMETLCRYLGEVLQSQGEVEERLRRAAAARRLRHALSAAGVLVIVALSGSLIVPRLPALRARLPAPAWLTGKPPAVQTASAEPPAPPPAPAPATREQQMHDFAMRYFAAISGPPANALDFLAGSVADPVRFYGRPIPLYRLVATQRAYFERWPERSFSVRPDSVSVVCGFPESPCSVSAIVDYTLLSQPRAARSTGADQIAMRIAGTGAAMRLSELSSIPIAQHIQSVPAPHAEDAAAQKSAPPHSPE